LARVLPRLRARGIEIRVHTIAGGGALVDILEASGIAVVVPNAARPTGVASGIAMRLLRLARASLSLIATYLRWRPDIVHFFLPGAYLVGAPLALLTSGAKRVVSRRSLNDYQSKRPELARLERWLHGQMHALAGNSAAIIAQLAAEGAPRERLHLIHNGVDLTAYDAPSVSPCLSRPLTLLIVANLIPYKGHADLIAALAGIADRMPEWHLLCAGRDDGIGAALAAQAHAAGLAGRIEFLGSRRDVPDLLAACDIAVLASHEEGFPNAVIEAMAAGKPVIATAVGGVPEAVKQGETGLLVPAHDPTALGDAILRLANDPARRAAMGQAARARARTLFGLDACVDRYLALYRGLTAPAALPGAQHQNHP